MAEILSNCEVSILMVTYNSSHLLHRSIGPLVGLPNCEVIVVDNASADDTVQSIRDSFPSVRIIENDTNLGFGKAMNLAARSSKGDVLILLNPDAEISSHDMYDLVSRNRKDGGISAPAIHQPTGRLAIHSAGRFPTIWRMFLHFSGLSRVSYLWPVFEGHYLMPFHSAQRSIKTDWVTGAVLAISRSTWILVDGLSERWFMYAEDIDLCWKVRKRDLAVILHTDIKALHSVGGSDSTESFSANSAWIVNLLDFYRLRISKRNFLARTWCAVVSLGLLSRAGAYGIRAVKRSGNEYPIWMTEARKFGIYSAAVFKSAIYLPSFQEGK